MSRARATREGIPLAGQQLLSLLSMGVALAVLVAWASASYFSVDVVGSLIWPGDDGYCNAATQGLGKHCFSDLAMFLGLGFTMDPEGLSGSIKFYPPLNRLGFFVFQAFAAGFGQHVAVLAYVALSAACLILPVAWVSRGLPMRIRILIISLSGLLTFPFLATIDRGNNIAFAVPLIFGFVMAIHRHRYGVAIVAIVIGSQIKPQIGLLAIGFLVLRRYMDFVIAAVSAVSAFLMSFVIFWVLPGGLTPLQEFKDFVLYIRFFDQYLPLTQMYPLNISFVHLLGVAYEGLGLGVASTDSLQWFVYSIVGAAMLLIIWRGAQIGVAVWFPAVLMGVLLTPNPVFAYYLTGALVVASFFFHASLAGQIQDSPLFVRGLLVAAVVASLVPLLIPAGWAEAPAPTVGEGVVVSLLPRIASVLWFAYLIAVAIFAVRTSRESVVIHEDVMES